MDIFKLVKSAWLSPAQLSWFFMVCCLAVVIVLAIDKWNKRVEKKKEEAERDYWIYEIDFVGEKHKKINDYLDVKTYKETVTMNFAYPLENRKDVETIMKRVAKKIKLDFINTSSHRYEYAVIKIRGFTCIAEPTCGYEVEPADEEHTKLAGREFGSELYCQS